MLHGRRELLEEMRPFLGGGHMISRVEREHSTWNELPWKFEAGTNAIAEAIGLGAAVDYLGEIGMERVRAHERELTAYALERLPEVEGITLFGPADVDRRGGVVSFTIEGMHPHDIAELCDREAVCIRAGHHCAQPLMRCLGVGATARATFHVYNTREDVDRWCDALDRARARCSSSELTMDAPAIATTSSTTTRTRGTSASSSRTTSSSTTTTRSAATSWACTSWSRTARSPTCASTARAARSRRPPRRSPPRS